MEKCINNQVSYELIIAIKLHVHNMFFCTVCIVYYITGCDLDVIWVGTVFN